MGNSIMNSKPFIDEMLYVVDGELMNHMLKIYIRNYILYTMYYILYIINFMLFEGVCLC